MTLIIDQSPSPIRQKLLRPFLNYDWESKRHPHQIIPEGEHRIVLSLGGRGSGKTELGSRTINDIVANHKDHQPLRIALVGETVADVNKVMVNGVSGLIATSPPWNRPTYIPSDRKVIWPNGCEATTFSGDEPKQLRGPQFHFAWVDEFCKFRYVTEMFDNLEMGIRLQWPNGTQPWILITTTPKPIKELKILVADETVPKLIGSTFDNEANLAKSFLDRMRSKYEGTKLGEQELYAKILEDIEGALMHSDNIKIVKELAEELVYISVGVDPAGGADETGIVSVGLSHYDITDQNNLPRLYVLADNSINASPYNWANRVKETFDTTLANNIAAESNFGGDMVESNIRTIDSSLPIEMVRASRGKLVRAEFLGSISEQKRFYMVGNFAQLKSELTTYLPGMPSPNRLDACVWAAMDCINQLESPSNTLTVA